MTLRPLSIALLLGCGHHRHHRRDDAVAAPGRGWETTVATEESGHIRFVDRKRLPQPHRRPTPPGTVRTAVLEIGRGGELAAGSRLDS